ncbi:hypothetical protein HO173_012145 [Letharia columbiana]|uniref:AMP-dependent synthetase/ligase domain-containing protein n=1 Tax=Letharia columbiana TaxID=112416 RepID=A0A8H6FGU3_9LECA|nr:uncharacterized protein HO173_012145 [Letharia columbiana]KAF6227616.1 hypothetical protein HO173_012145 [Letharia columbiana]
MGLVEAAPDEVANEASSADLEQIRKWNQFVPPAIEACVHHLIEEKVRDQPNAEAVRSREGALTYGDLDSYANGLASHLVHHGIKPEDIIPVCFEKSMWTVVAMLAVLKAGAAFVPIPCSPVQRVKTILSLIRPSVILTSTQQAAVFANMSEHVIVVGQTCCDEIGAAKREPLRVDVRPNNLAYILFTSGSTGIPKVS